jgi:hypothetical protein
LDEGITLLPLAAPATASIDAAAADRAASVIGDLADSHDIVLVDAGTIDAGDVNSTIAGRNGPAVDAAVLVYDVRNPDQTELRKAVTELAHRGINTIALAENFAVTAAAPPTREAA